MSNTVGVENCPPESGHKDKVCMMSESGIPGQNLCRFICQRVGREARNNGAPVSPSLSRINPSRPHGNAS